MVYYQYLEARVPKQDAIHVVQFIRFRSYLMQTVLVGTVHVDILFTAGLFLLTIHNTPVPGTEQTRLIQTIIRKRKPSPLYKYFQ